MPKQPLRGQPRQQARCHRSMPTPHDDADLAALRAGILRRRRPHCEFLARHRFVDVDRDIAAGDEMFAGDLDDYLLTGLSALHWIEVATLAAERKPDSLRQVLDLPCGHGRVLRALRAALPDAELVACDLDRGGVDYCAARFRARGVYGAADPDAIALPDGFDLIWVGSLFTHFAATAWQPFLARLARALAPGGVLVLTSAGPLVAALARAGEHGGLRPETCAAMLDDYARDGFGFGAYPQQTDSGQVYGRAVAAPDWVRTQLAALIGVRLVLHAPAAWMCRQDVWAVARDA